MATQSKQIQRITKTLYDQSDRHIEAHDQWFIGIKKQSTKMNTAEARIGTRIFIWGKGEEKVALSGCKRKRKIS